jgi:hypothetical protein
MLSFRDTPTVVIFQLKAMRIHPIFRRNSIHWWAVVATVCFLVLALFPGSTRSGDLFGRLTSLLPTKEVKLGGAPRRLQVLATSIVRDQIPLEHEDTRKWGSTKEVFDGWHVKADGLKVYTKRKWKSVNHGTWKRYRITQIDPEENIVVRIEDIREVGAGKVAFRVELKSKVNAYARLQTWKRGVRLASVSVDADADILLTADCVLGSRLDPTHLPPDIILQPEITDATLTLQRFEVNRISKVGGDVAEELGRGLRKILETKIEEKRPKIVSKINAKIAKSEDKLRFSMHDFFAEKFSDSEAEGG